MKRATRGTPSEMLAGFLRHHDRPGDKTISQRIERVVFEVRTEIANVCQQMADKHGEPPLDDG